MAKKVFVSGCFDLLHSGHIAFFQEAASYGDLYVAIGSDRTVYELKGRKPVNSEDERLFVIQSISCVKQALISQGSGILDFVGELKDVAPDILIVNEEGDTPDKEALCRKLGVQYLVLKREPHADLTPRSTTALRDVNRIPYRIDLAGGWLDQPCVSRKYPGAVITISLEPTIEFNERSGMASSTRRKAIEIWGPRVPVGDLEKLAKILFCFDNPPGTEYVSGAQDSIGIVYPGLARSCYEGTYWPTRIDHVRDETVLQFIEQSIYLKPLGPRHAGYEVLSNTHITKAGASALATASENCWQAILRKDLQGFGRFAREAFEAQIALYPNMMNPMARELIQQVKDKALGWKLSGAGGGGYLILVAEKPIENAVRVLIRREDY
ncbi:MAG: adenylyltransferase/cytidyltransferase family protein [Candidatus Latescibacterota bacterium]